MLDISSLALLIVRMYYVPVLCMQPCKAMFLRAEFLHELQARGKKQSAKLQLGMELLVVYLDAGHIYAQRGSPFCLLITATVG